MTFSIATAMAAGGAASALRFQYATGALQELLRSSPEISQDIVRTVDPGELSALLRGERIGRAQNGVVDYLLGLEATIFGRLVLTSALPDSVVRQLSMEVAGRGGVTREDLLRADRWTSLTWLRRFWEARYETTLTPFHLVLPCEEIPQSSSPLYVQRNVPHREFSELRTRRAAANLVLPYLMTPQGRNPSAAVILSSGSLEDFIYTSRVIQAARSLGIGAIHVFVDGRICTPQIGEALAREGHVTLHQEKGKSAVRWKAEECARRGSLLFPPLWGHPLLTLGAATMVTELVAEVVTKEGHPPKTIVVPSSEVALSFLDLGGDTIRVCPFPEFEALVTGGGLLSGTLPPEGPILAVRHGVGSVFWMTQLRSAAERVGGPLSASLNGLVYGGDRLRLPSLGLTLLTPPGIRLTTHSDVYSLLERGDCRFFLVGKILYVVPKKKLTPSIEAGLREAIEDGDLSEVKSLHVTPKKTLPPRSPTLPESGLLEYPWQDSGEMGPLDLTVVPEGVRERWVKGKNPPPLVHLEDLQALHSFFQSHTPSLHWSDLRRFEKLLQALWVAFAQGEVTAEQRKDFFNKVLGLLTEIEGRDQVLGRYRDAVAHYPSLLLFVEGEIRTPDGREVSDALIGRLDPERRRFQTTAAVEIAVGEKGEALEEQHRHTLEKRLPEKGLVILAANGEWGRVAVETEGAERHVFIPPRSVADLLRATAGTITDEVWSYLSIRRATAAVIPEEERKTRARGGAGSSAVGRHVHGIVVGLWEEVRRCYRESGEVDLGWLIVQLETREKSSPPPVASRFKAHRRVLINVSRDLNPTGVRVSKSALARELWLTIPAINTDVQTITSFLEDMKSPILPDPEVRQSRARRRGSRTSKIVAGLLSRSLATPQALKDGLEEIIAKTEDPEVKARLAVSVAALVNVSRDLNPRGRLSVAEVARDVTASTFSVRQDQRAFVKWLKRHKAPHLDDPEARRGGARSAGWKARRTFREIFEGPASSPQALKEALERAVAEEEDEKVRDRIEVFLAVLVDLSRDLNPTGERRGVRALARDLGVDAHTLRTDRQRIAKKLK